MDDSGHLAFRRLTNVGSLWHLRADFVAVGPMFLIPLCAATTDADVYCHFDYYNYFFSECADCLNLSVNEIQEQYTYIYNIFLEHRMHFYFD